MVKKGTRKPGELAKSGRFPPIEKELLKLTKKECSDEGLMSEEISECLKPVIHSVKTAGDRDAAKWAREMQLADRVGFICDKELAELRAEL